MTTVRIFFIVSAVCCTWVAATAYADPAEGVESSATPTTRLYVKTLPTGAQVTLDGKPLGPSDGLFLVPAGTAQVSVQFDGQAPQVRQVEIAEGRITRVEIQSAGSNAMPPMAGGGVAPAGIGNAFGGAVPRLPIIEPNDGFTSSRKLAAPPAPLTKFDMILAKPIDFEVRETPLRDAARVIGEKAGLRISFDHKALGDVGIDLEKPITASASGLSVAQCLDIVCRSMNLAWAVEDDGLRIIPADRAWEQPVMHVHDVSDLCERDMQAVIDTILNSIAPLTWNTVGGRGAILPDISETGTFLVVSQSLAVQRRIAGFLDCLRRLKAVPPAERTPIASDGYWSLAEPAVRARKALAAPITAVEFVDAPLQDALREISKKAGVPLAIDTRAFEEAGIDSASPVTIASTTLPLDRLLSRLLSPLALTYALVDDQLTVTTKDKAAETLSVAIYPVDRLVGRAPPSRSLGALIDLILCTVEPETWNTVGGMASIMPIDGDLTCLVICHTTAGHRAVDAFLKSLR